MAGPCRRRGKDYQPPSPRARFDSGIKAGQLIEAERAGRQYIDAPTNLNGALTARPKPPSSQARSCTLEGPSQESIVAVRASRS